MAKFNCFVLLIGMSSLPNSYMTPYHMGARTSRMATHKGHAVVTHDKMVHPFYIITRCISAFDRKQKYWYFEKSDDETKLLFVSILVAPGSAKSCEHTFQCFVYPLFLGSLLSEVILVGICVFVWRGGGAGESWNSYRKNSRTSFLLLRILSMILLWTDLKSWQHQK